MAMVVSSNTSRQLCWRVRSSCWCDRHADSFNYRNGAINFGAMVRISRWAIGKIGGTICPELRGKMRHFDCPLERAIVGFC